jgi:hypothetical protein
MVRRQKEAARVAAQQRQIMQQRAEELRAQKAVSPFMASRYIGLCLHSLLLSPERILW